MDSLSEPEPEPERARERDRKQAVRLPASPPDTLQHHTTLSYYSPLQPIATHRARLHTYTTLTHTPPSTPTRYTLPPSANNTGIHNNTPHAHPPPRPPPACLALLRLQITPLAPCIARRRRALQSPVTCELPALASSLRPSHNLALRNGVKSMHAPPSAACRSHWHSAACDRATLAPNKPRHPLTVIHRSSSGNTSSW